MGALSGTRLDEYPEPPDYEDSDEEFYDLEAIERALMANPLVRHGAPAQASPDEPAGATTEG